MREVSAVANPVRALVRKEARESVWKLVVAVLIFAVLGGMLGPLYDWLSGLMPQVDLSTLPGWVRDPLDAQMRSYVHYIWGNWYGKNLMQFLVILVIVYGAGLIAAETSRGTSGFLFSKPIRRSTVVRTKYLVALGVLWVATVLGTIATLIGSSVAGRPVDWGWFMSAIPANLAATALVLAVTELFSVLMRDTAKAIAAAVVLVALSAFAGAFAGLRQLSVFVHMAAGRSFLTGQVDWLPVGVMLALSVLVVGVAEVMLSRRDI